MCCGRRAQAQRPLLPAAERDVWFRARHYFAVFEWALVHTSMPHDPSPLACGPDDTVSDLKPCLRGEWVTGLLVIRAGGESQWLLVLQYTRVAKPQESEPIPIPIGE